MQHISESLIVSQSTTNQIINHHTRRQRKTFPPKKQLYWLTRLSLVTSS